MIWRWENRWFLVDFPLKPIDLHGKIEVSGEDFPLNLNQSIELWFLQMNWWFFINPKSEVNQLRYCMVSILFNTDLDMNCTQLNTSEYYVCNTLPGQCNNMRKLCFLARVIIWSKQIQVMSFMHFCSGRPRHRMPMMQLFFWPVFTSTESSCVKNLRHDFLKLSMEMVGYSLKWNMSWYLRHYFLKWCSTRYPLKVSETSHLVDVTGMMISKDNHPHMALLQLFSVLWIVTIQPGLRLAQVPTEGTYKKEQMRVM